MDFEWIEDIRWLKKVKDAIAFRHRAGDILSFAPRLGLIQRPGGREPGISALMRLKNEAHWIEAAIRSLSPFVEQFSIVDNGSTDGTPEIIKRVAEELSLNYVLEILPTDDFGEVCDRALQNTTCQWVLRWDGDMIARTQGEKTFGKIRDFVFSLDPERYYAIYFPHVRLEGDLFHQSPDQLLHHEEWLFTYSPQLYHRRTGRYREVIYPLYYKRIYIWKTTSFHIASLDDPVSLVQRKYWEEWRKLNDLTTFPTLASYAKTRIREDYGTDSFEEAGALYMRERFRNLVPYDRERFGDYPELMKPYIESPPFRLVYRNGRIAGRSDIIEILDRIDKQIMNTSVDMIIPTRNREEITIRTVEKLLKENYPNFRIIVCDQSDTPSEHLQKMSEYHKHLLYHRAESRGLPDGRNEGFSLSQAKIVIFVDDDIIPKPGFIEGHVRAYESESTGGVTGKIIETRPEAQKNVPPHKGGKVNYWTGKLYRGYTFDSLTEVDHIQGGNMSFKCEVLEKVGGFDKNYGGSALFEETDISLRIRKLGYRLRYTPEAVLTHLGVSTGGTRITDIG
ncbi:glycosyltransferase, partial [Candidatus Latescibacterota bacterium]